jgi:hypothetical protein
LKPFFIGALLIYRWASTSHNKGQASVSICLAAGVRGAGDPPARN